MYQKLSAVCCKKSLPTFLMLPNFQFQMSREMPWNFYVWNTRSPRPVRFLFTEADDPNKAEREYLKGQMQRQDMDLFIRLVGLENVPRYFRWTLGNLQRVSAGVLDFEDMPDDAHWIF